MSDPIAEVQAMVGCPHEWKQKHLSFEAEPWFECEVCGEETAVGPPFAPSSAPDCSTLWGALQAARQRGVDVDIGTEVRGKSPTLVIAYSRLDFDSVRRNYCVRGVNTEREAATAICELILQAVKDQGGG